MRIGSLPGQPSVVRAGWKCARSSFPHSNSDERKNMSKYELPELDYDYAALEPHISARIMELHHSKHHKAYVDGANAAVAKLEELRESGDYASVNGVEKNLAFHLGGHTNHSVFWKNMSPDGSGQPEG